MYWGLALFSISLTIGTLTTLVFAYLGWTRRRDVGATPFILMMLAIAVWSLAYTFELSTPILEEKIIWHKVSYLGIPYVPVCWFIFNAQVLGFRFASQPLWLALISLVSVCVMALTLTLDYHTLVWGNFSLRPDQGLLFLDIQRNSEFFFYAAYSYALLALGTLFFIVVLLRSPAFRLPLVAMLAFGVTISIIMNALQIIFNLEISIPFDLSPLTLAIIGGTAGWCVFRFGPLDVLSVARIALLENISEGFVVLGLSGRVISINGAAQKMIGIQEEQAVGLTLYELMPTEYQCFDPKTGQEVEPDWAMEKSDAQKPASIQQSHYELRLPRGVETQEEYYIDLSVNRLFDQRNRARGMLLVLRDITQRRETQQALMQAQRMESAGVLAGGVAHDFNNLLAAIQMRHQLAQNRLKIHASDLQSLESSQSTNGWLPGESHLILQTLGLGQTERNQIEEMLTQQWSAMVQPVSRHIDIAGNALNRAADLTRQLLAYTGKGRFKIEPVDVNRLIEENQALLSTAVPKKIELRIHLSEELLVVDVDRGQLQQVIMNLLLNAVEAMEDDDEGIIDVQTTLCHVDREAAHKYIWKGAPQPGVYAHLCIKDGGAGMSAEVQSRIFEPFFTTKPKGRGLGLSAALGAIHLYNGGIQVSSKQNSGTVFQALFPITESPGHRHNLSEPEAERTDAVNLDATVLVADDEPPILDVLEEILTDIGLRVLKATNGREAVELYHANQQQVHFVLLDSKMPIMGGLEALSEMRKLSPQLCALLSSGYSEMAFAHSVTWDTQTDFLQKPYDVDVLIEKIERLAKRARQQHLQTEYKIRG